jgi:hypothetical protein
MKATDIARMQREIGEKCGKMRPVALKRIHDLKEGNKQLTDIYIIEELMDLNETVEIIDYCKGFVPDQIKGYVEVEIRKRLKDIFNELIKEQNGRN